MVSFPIPSTTIHLSNPATKDARQKYLLFFIPGNPGVLEYYRTFLSHLFALISSKEPECDIHLFSESMAGFECDSNSTSRLSPEESLPMDVEGQINFIERMLRRHIKSLSGGSGDEWKVILVAHSLGSYISLELIRRCWEKGEEEESSGMRIIGSICLFPGILHLAKSPNAIAWGSLPYYTHLPLLVSLLIRILTFLIPVSILALAFKFSDMPPDAASTTAHLIKSKWGVRQGLYMARDELHKITHDKWDNEVWDSLRTQIFILWGKNDLWIPDEYRDELIKRRGRKYEAEEERWKPVMEIDETGLPHGFCIRHGVKVAEKVAEKVGPWIRDVIQTDIQRDVLEN